jgi:hypothetical protein
LVPKSPKFWKAVTVARISSGVAPEASNTSGSAEAIIGWKTSVKPKAAAAAKRLIELLTSCLVCIGFFFLRFGFCFVFPGTFIVLPVHVIRRQSSRKPATTAHFFWLPRAAVLNVPLVWWQRRRSRTQALYLTLRTSTSATRQRRRQLWGKAVSSQAEPQRSGKTEQHRSDSLVS